MAGESERNAKMHAAARWRAGGGFDEDRASRERVVIYRGGKRGLERGTVTREERRTCRYEMERRRGRGAREEIERVRHRAGARERARGNGGEKERRYGRKERRNDIERERKREAARVKAGGREREGARRRGRRRERDGRICVLKQTFDQSADCCQSYVAAAYPSVPVAGPRIQFRVFTRRGNQGLSARAAIRENRALNVSRSVLDDRAACLGLNPRPSSRPQGSRP